MAVDVDKNAAAKVLQQTLARCEKAPVNVCPIAATIDFTLDAKSSLTYRYILLTALTAKATDPRVDILSLQASDLSEGSYDARSLCSKVVYPFQQLFLGDTIDGSNPDPLVNKPGRYHRLRPGNAAAGGDPTKVLHKLCDDLPKVSDQSTARVCLAYMVSRLLERQHAEEARRKAFSEVAAGASLAQARRFVDELLDNGFGGSALVLVASAMYRVLFPAEGGYEVVPHPVNQAGSSSRQNSDLDVLRDKEPYLATELKDKPFTSSDVNHAVETARSAGVRAVLFIGGRQSTIAGQSRSYFKSTRDRWMRVGVYVGVMPIDALVDFVFATHQVEAPKLLDGILSDAERMKDVEAQMWVYKRVGQLRKDSRTA